MADGPIRFGVFEVDLAGRTLRKSGVRIRLQEKPFRLLALLLARPGEVVTREELKQELWPDDEYGEFDLGLNTAVKKLRQALGDSAESPRWIETVPKLGYKFLGEVGQGTAGRVDAAASRPRLSTPVLVGALALGAACLAAGWFLGSGGDASGPPPFHLELAPPPGVAYTSFALSPDGSRVAVIGEGSGSPRVWVQSLADHTARALEGTENADPVGTPFWSPDGTQIGFFAGGKLKRTGAEGGGVQTLCDAPYGRGGAWNDNGVIVFAPRTDSGLWTVNLFGGDCEPFIAKRHEESSIRSPQFLPDRDRLLFTRRGHGGSGTAIGAASLSGGELETVLEDVGHVTHVKSERTGRDYLLYVREGTLWARSFEPTTLKTQDREIALAEGVASDAMLFRGLFSVSPVGVLAYLPKGAESRKREIAWFARNGDRLRPVTQADSWGLTISMAPNEEWAVYWQSHPEHNINRLDLVTGISTGIASGTVPSISPSGRAALYTSRDGLVMQPAGGGEPRTLVEEESDKRADPGTFRKFFCSLLEPTGAFFFQQLTPDGWDLWTASLEGGSPRPFLAEPFDEGQAQFHPSGDWFAYVSDESGRREVYVRAYPSTEHKTKVSRAGGWLPRWRSNGAELFYVDDAGMLTAVAIGREGNQLRPGVSEPLFPVSSMYSNVEPYEFAPEYTYDVSPDGQRFLALWRPPDMPFPPLQVVTNWEAKLAREQD